MIAIVDYKAGNLTSVRLAVEKLGARCQVTSDSKVILSADRVIFPGVGAARTAMGTIKSLGLADTIKAVVNKGVPFLGICLGAQIILDTSVENDGVSCLGLIPGSTKMFESTSQVPIKIPQIGWNQVSFIGQHPVFKSIPAGAEFYFVHSYYPAPAERCYSLGQTVYGETAFTSIVGCGNIVACQFHPERSGKWGLMLLENFLKWDGRGASC